MLTINIKLVVTSANNIPTYYLNLCTFQCSILTYDDEAGARSVIRSGFKTHVMNSGFLFSCYYQVVLARILIINVAALTRTFIWIEEISAPEFIVF